MVGITKGCPSTANPTWQTSASSRMASITSRSYAPRSGCRFTMVRADGTPEAYWYARTMARSVIVSAVRTPFGKLGGSLADKEATELGAIAIRAGDHQVIVAGGMESMSNAPYVLKNARFGYRLGDGSLIDLMIHDGLTSTFDNRHMVEQASFVSRELGISREDQDRWALRSHERAVKATDEGKFREEIVPVGELAVDEGPRRDTSYERLSRLKPVFDPEGTTTAGNSPSVNDGAGALVVTSEEFARRRGLEPLATIVAQAYV